MSYEKILDSDSVQLHKINGKEILEVPASIFEKIAQISFEEMRYFFPKSHLENWKKILDSPESSESEKEKMQRNLEASVEAKNKKVPYCQDCGTDIAYVFRGNQTIVSDSIFNKIQKGATIARKKNPFRNSIFVPTSNFSEKNSGDNTPCEVHFGDSQNPQEISGIFSNKGGGSGSKLWSFSEPPSLYQDRKKLIRFLAKKLVKIGHSACPPYHLKIILGGLSHLQNSQFLTLATVDEYAWTKDENLKSIRDEALEQEIQDFFKKSNLGAQGEGKFFLMPNGLKIFRAPRHAAHFFVGMGVSCSANRIQRFKINDSGVFLEKLCKNPENFLDSKTFLKQKNHAIKINLEEDLETVLAKLRNIKSGTNFLISGKILGARDKAHARWIQDFEKNGHIPDYLKKYLAWDLLIRQTAKLLEVLDRRQRLEWTNLPSFWDNKNVCHCPLRKAHEQQNLLEIVKNTNPCLPLFKADPRVSFGIS